MKLRSFLDSISGQNFLGGSIPTALTSEHEQQIRNGIEYGEYGYERAEHDIIALLKEIDRLREAGREEPR